MTHPVHLLVSADDPGAPSRVMKALGQRYVQYINRTYRRSCGLWEGRFRSCLVQQDDCLFACLRCVEMNPVHASMVEQLADYRWSSYRAHAHGAFDTLLTPHAAYLALGTNPDERQQRYRMLFREQLAQQVLEDILDATRGNFVLGNPKCAAEVAVALGRHALIRLHRRSASASILSSWPVDVIDLHARMRRPSSNRTLRRHDHKSVRLADFPSARQGRFF
jgi:putative transposase